MAKQREIIGTDPSDKNKIRVKVEVDDRGTPKSHEYSMFKDAEVFRNAVAGAALLTAEDYGKIEDSAKRQQTLNWYFDKYDYALGLEERASVRAAVAAESTVIMVDKVATDLMNLPLENLVFGINGAKMMKLVGKDIPGAFVVAERKLIESGKARINAQGALEIAG